MQEPAPPGDLRPQPAALLHCLSQLGDARCALFLLPKLDKGSAAAVALTCSQLCKLSHNTKQSLNLRLQLDTTDTRSLRSMQQSLPLHFPNCSAVSVELKSDKCYHNMPYLLPALARWVWGPPWPADHGQYISHSTRCNGFCYDVGLGGWPSHAPVFDITP